MGTANLVVRALKRKEGILAGKHLELGGDKKQHTYALTAAYYQSESNITVFILLQVGETLRSNPAFGDNTFFVAKNVKTHVCICILIEKIMVTYLACVSLLGTFLR